MIDRIAIFILLACAIGFVVSICLERRADNKRVRREYLRLYKGGPL